MKRKYIVYKVTNRFDGKFYIGCHSTLNANDRYMGSGTEIKEALKKFGRKSFVKEILFEYDTKEEMLTKEKELVTKEFCMRTDTYNRIEGGGVYVSLNMITVKDKEGNTSKVYNDDPRYLSGELVGVSKNTVVVIDKLGKILRVNIDDFRYLSGELITINKGKNNSPETTFKKGHSRGNGWSNKTHLEITKTKMSNKAKLRVGNKNSSFGSCWINKAGTDKKIKKEDLNAYIDNGWLKGRSIMKCNLK